MVVDADSGAIVGDIPNTLGVHGVAIAAEFGKGFTSNGRDASVTIFDLKTLKLLGQVKVGQNPDAILFDPTSKRVFTFNGSSKDTTAIDAKSGTVAGTLALGGRPESGVADGNGKIFVNIEDTSQVVEFDARKLTIDATWSLAPGQEPTGIAMDRKHRRLFVGCANKLMAVMNADNGKLVATLPIGSGVDATAFDSETQLAFSSNGDGTLTVVHEDAPDKLSVVENVATQRGARTMALDPKTHRIFLITAEFGPPPAPTTEQPRPRPTVVPGSFTLLVLGRQARAAGSGPTLMFGRVEVSARPIRVPHGCASRDFVATRRPEFFTDPLGDQSLIKMPDLNIPFDRSNILLTLR